jgi:ketosteroid isomerase-like protein
VQTLSEIDRLLIRVAVEAVIVEYTYWHDRQDEARVAELLAEDLVVTDHRGRSVPGRQGVLERLARRPPGRLVRHATSNIRVVVIDADHAEATRLMVYYVSEAGAEGSTLPQAMADYHEGFVRGADGRWRIRSRSVVHLYGAAPP